MRELQLMDSPVHDADAEATECRLQNVGAMAP